MFTWIWNGHASINEYLKKTKEKTGKKKKINVLIFINIYNISGYKWATLTWISIWLLVSDL